MLQRLSIENVALIDRLDIEFGPGLNVFTGETGAGKSIIIDAVNLVLGERASKDLIKHGALRARVDALFDVADRPAIGAALMEQGIPCDEDTLLLSREISSSGKSVCRMNGTLCVLSALKRISDMLVDIHGQHEHQSLLFPAKHLGFVDAFAGKDASALRAEVNGAYERLSSLRAERLGGFLDEGGREREMDILRYQIGEIERSGVYEGEEEELLSERRILANAERIMEAVAGARDRLGGADRSALESVRESQRLLAGIADFSGEYASLASRIEEAYYALEDIAISLRDRTADLEFDPKRYDALERRLESISDLKRKYGQSERAILDFAISAKGRLNALENAGARIKELDALIADTTQAYLKKAALLTEARKCASYELERGILSQLGDLGLDKARFEVRFLPRDSDAPRHDGMDDVEFMLSTNPGEPLKPLAKVASGGELARIMLAFKAVFAECDDMGTLIFDEIDAGISGSTALVVGAKMMGIARTRQVISVTHLAQIAALADAHFLVEKRDDGVTTTIGAARLDPDGAVRRIAMMMDGSSDSPLALEHARTFIRNAGKQKKAE